jgi:hypothetical protein
MAQIILDSNSNLIQGDFDSATVNNRTKLQTSTTNATTGVYVVPNGSATSASVQMANAADPTNASKIVVATNGATDTQIVSGANGSGSYLPLSFYTNNDIRFQMGNAGELNVRTAPGTVSSGTSGQFLTSGGPGAGVSWTTAGGQLQTELFTAPGTWTKPASCTQVRVTVVGAGGGGGKFNAAGSIPGKAAGSGGIAVAIVPVSAPVSITVGTAGNGGSPGGGSGTSGTTSSFGPAVSSTGGGGGGGPAIGVDGAGTVSVGTSIRTGVSFQPSPIVSSVARVSSPSVLGVLGGERQDSSTPGIAFTTTGIFSAGAGGVAAGPGPTAAGGGIGGAVLVEFVG